MLSLFVPSAGLVCASPFPQAHAAPGDGGLEASADAADGGVGRSCTMEVQGPFVETQSCKLVYRSGKRDGGSSIETIVWIMSVEDASARTSIRGNFLLEGIPRVGLQHDKHSGGAAVFADSHVSRDRVEWEAVSFRYQGTIDITLTSVKKVAGQEGYEIHGTFEAVMPYTNLPVGNPTPDVTLRISF